MDRIPHIYYASASSANNLDLPQSKIWDFNLKAGLKKVSKKISEPAFDVSKQYTEALNAMQNGDLDYDSVRRKYSEKLLHDIKRKHSKQKVQLFFSYYSSRHILPELVEEIKSLGILTVNYYCNNVHQFHLVKEIAPYFDFNLFPEKNAISKYKAVGANPVHMQFAANPEFYRPFDLSKTYDVSFVGQMYFNRDVYFRYLHKKGLDFYVFGPGWDKYKRREEGNLVNRIISRLINFTDRDIQKYIEPPPSDEDMVKIYSKSKISLNFSEVLVREESGSLVKRHLRLRDFEAPMSGAFYMTGCQEELGEYFEIGKEVICYQDKEDLAHKIKFYLGKEKKMNKIREAARKKSTSEHTWDKRFKKAFREMGLKKFLK